MGTCPYGRTPPTQRRGRKPPSRGPGTRQGGTLRRADGAPDEWRHVDPARGVGPHEQEHADSEDGGWARQSERREGRVAMTHHNSQRGIEDKREGNQHPSDQPSPSQLERDLDAMSCYPKPGEGRSAGQAKSAKGPGCLVDVGEERPVISQACPSPQRRQDGADPHARARRSAERQPHDRHCTEFERDLRRPNAPVVGGHDLEELRRGEGQVHAGHSGGMQGVCRTPC